MVKYLTCLIWRVGQRLYIARTHTPIVEELELESALESADYSHESPNSNADPPNIGVWVRALSVFQIWDRQLVLLVYEEMLQQMKLFL